MPCNSYFGSGGADGSWVEHATNISHLPDFDFTKHFRPFVERRLPPELQAPLLHEMTHHWCFDSPVGWALSLLRFRLLANAMRSAGGPLPAEADDELWMDISRYEVAIELMRPVMEGLALFVEHDAVVEGKFSYSPPLTSLLGLLHGHMIQLLKERGDEVADEAELVPLVQRASLALIKLARTLPEGIERKADLLVSPIDSERPAGHYLIGYLTLRYIWAQLRGKVGLLNNSDAFASYVRSYFFHDWGLVAAILDDCDNEIALATRIGQYLQKRLLWLLDAPAAELETALEEWDKGADDAQTVLAITLFDDGTIGLDGFDKVIPGTNSGPGETETGQRLLRDAMVWFNFIQDQEPEIRTVKQWSLRRFTCRGLMPVVQETGTIQVEEGGAAIFLTAVGKPALAFEPFEPLPSGNHKGAVAELMFSQTAGEEALLIFLDGKVVGGTIPERFDFLRGTNMLGPSFASGADIETLKLWEATHGQVMRDADKIYSILYKHIAESTPKAISDIYILYVAGMLNQGDVDAMVARTRETGLFAYFDKDAGLIRSLARLGASAGTGARIERVEQHFAKAGEDLPTVLERLERIRAKTDVPTFLDLDGVLVPMV